MGTSSRVGMVAVFEPDVLSCYFDWYPTDGFMSTFEWMIRQQEILAGGSFKTRYVLLPLSEFRRVDGMLNGSAPDVSIACGIVFPPQAVKSGEAFEVVIDLVASAYMQCLPSRFA